MDALRFTAYFPIASQLAPTAARVPEAVQPLMLKPFTVAVFQPVIAPAIVSCADVNTISVVFGIGVG